MLIIHNYVVNVTDHKTGVSGVARLVLDEQLKRRMDEYYKTTN